MLQAALFVMLLLTPLVAIAGDRAAKETQEMPRDNTKLLELARHLVPDDPSLVEEVRFAVERPNDYVGRFAERLSNRGIEKPFPELSWIALVDGLYARNRLREVDWKDAAEDIAWNLDQLVALKPARADRWIWLNESQWDNALPEQSLPAIAEHLRDEGLELVTVDINSDSYPLMVLPPARVAEAQRLAKAAGYGKIVSCGAEK